MTTKKCIYKGLGEFLGVGVLTGLALTVISCEPKIKETANKEPKTRKPLVDYQDNSGIIDKESYQEFVKGIKLYETR